MPQVILGAVGPRLEPKIPLILLDAADSRLTMDFEIDTAFAGFLALPTPLITHLVLPLIGDFPVELADGRQVLCPCHEARVEWLGSIRTVRAFDLGPDLLVGINFFWGQRITMDIIVGGPVTIEPIP